MSLPLLLFASASLISLSDCASTGGGGGGVRDRPPPPSESPQFGSGEAYLEETEEGHKGRKKYLFECSIIGKCVSLYYVLNKASLFWVLLVLLFLLLLLLLLLLLRFL